MAVTRPNSRAAPAKPASKPASTASKAAKPASKKDTALTVKKPASKPASKAASKPNSKAAPATEPEVVIVKEAAPKEASSKPAHKGKLPKPYVDVIVVSSRTLASAQEMIDVVCRTPSTLRTSNALAYLAPPSSSTLFLSMASKSQFMSYSRCSELTP